MPAATNVMSIYEKDAAGFWLTEQSIYGSDRLGMRSTMINLAEESSLTTVDHSFGQKQYELKNHLGNVLAVVSDRKDSDGNVLMISAMDYYPFGMLSKSFNSSSYRYGYNSMEKDDEIKGVGNSYTTAFRQYDPRIARWMTLDPKANAWESPYVSMGNNPMNYVDFLGDSIVKFQIVEKGDTKYIHGQTTVYIDHRIVDDMKKVIQYAIETKTHIHINSSFRTLKKQGSPSIQSNGVTPASVGTSPHNGGFGLDFNLYVDNDVSKGTISKNKGVKSSNPWLTKVKSLEGWRIGADFNTPDPVHIDGENYYSTKGFKEMVVENQKQMNGGEEMANLDKYVNRTVTVTYLQNGDHSTVDNGIKEAINETHKVRYHYSAPEWAKNNIIGAHIYFIFTGKDPGLPDELQDNDLTND